MVSSLEPVSLLELLFKVRDLRYVRLSGRGNPGFAGTSRGSLVRCSFSYSDIMT
jgi:hypothetical protein